MGPPRLSPKAKAKAKAKAAKTRLNAAKKQVVCQINMHIAAAEEVAKDLRRIQGFCFPAQTVILRNIEGACRDCENWLNQLAAPDDHYGDPVDQVVDADAAATDLHFWTKAGFAVSEHAVVIYEPRGRGGSPPLAIH